MEISRDAYRAIEDIVGPENVTDDPAFLDSYAFEVAGRAGPSQPQPLYAAAWAVVMPGHDRRSAADHQSLQQVQDQGQADLDRLVSLGGAAEGRPSLRSSSICGGWTRSSTSTRRICSPSSSPT